MPRRPRRPFDLPRRTAVCCAAFLLAASFAFADVTIRVQPLARAGQLLVTCEMPQGITPEAQAAIKSGLPTTFVYIVELRQGTSLWLDRTIDEAVVAATVQYDNLRRTYKLQRTVNGRIEQSDVKDKEDDVRQWMTTFNKLALFSTNHLEANAEYYVRVRVRMQPRNASFVWPWGSGGISGLAKFTFIP
jgi:hypothetical protein